MERPPTTPTQRIAGFTVGAVSAVSVLIALFLTRRNRRLGRGDTKGATRLAGFLFALSMLEWLMSAHHVPSIELETQSLLIATAGGMLFAAIAAVLYLAVEPYVRRRMPELMIGWARVLEGRFRDPRVGRDVLVGAVLGGASALLVHASNALPTWIPILGQTTVPPSPSMIQGGSLVFAGLTGVASNSLVAALSLTFVLFLFRLVLKREWVSLAALMIVLSLTNLGGENVALETPFAVLQGVLAGWAIGRVGLLGAASMFLYRIVFSSLPLPIDASTPYTLSTLLVLGLMLALAGYALRVSVGSRRLFSVAALDD